MCNLPMIEFATSLFEDGDLENCYLIGVQHLLTTTQTMFEILVQKGLKPENIAILGKCYSTDVEIYKSMKSAGFDICDNSIYFDSHDSFDNQFKKHVSEFLHKRKSNLNSPKFKKIIVLDDGGELLAQVEDYLERFDHVVAMEQTSSGYNKLVNKKFRFPVLNMARAKIKLDFEAPYIVRNALEKIDEFIKSLDQSKDRNILICGNGAIGSKVYDILKDSHSVTKYDLVTHKSDIQVNELEKRLGEFDLIIGCTGNTSLTEDKYKYFKKGCILVSLSSSDREFDAVHVRKKKPRTSSTYTHIEHEGVTLLNCGFALPFNGTNVDDPEFFQFVRAIIISCIHQGIKCDNPKGFVSLNEETQELLLNRFKEIYKDLETIAAPETFI